MKKIDRFDKYMEYKGLNDNKVTTQLGISTGTIGKSRKPNRDLSGKVIEQILNFYTDLNRTWLLTGEGEMLKQPTNSATINAPNHGLISVGNGNTYNNATSANWEDIPETEVAVVPVVPRSIYTEPNVDILEYCKDNDVQMTPKIHQLSTYDLTYMVVNDEMTPYINPGDRIFLLAYPQGKERKVIDGRVYAVDTKLNGVLTRQLYKTKDGFIAKAYNNKYGTEEIEMDDIYRVYRIVGLLRMDD